MFFSAQVRFSQVEGGGEGLYARRNLVKGEIVAFYNGVSASIISVEIVLEIATESIPTQS